MADNAIYQDIAMRTGGDIYIGVVGPVRTGKSTFIHRFLECAILPNIENEYDRTRTVDTMPQSASGKTVMTTEPKFVPDESVEVHTGDATSFRVKMVDCVGYMVDGALGTEEEGQMRMVRTPWSDEPIPFAEAAQIGTDQVIRQHATIGMLVTTDGTIGDIPRENYVEAEERVVCELKKIGKPFCIVLNSAAPGGEQARKLAEELEQKYGVPVALVSCLALDAQDIREILGLVLGQFPVREMRFGFPAWVQVLEREHPVYGDLLDRVRTFCAKVHKLGDLDNALAQVAGIERIRVCAGDGSALFSLPLPADVYYHTVSELCGMEIHDERDLIGTMCDLAKIRREYEKVADALRDVEEKGYGVVMPKPDELEFEEPKMVRQTGGWGVKMAARAQSIHMIRAAIKTELSPMVGTEEQSEEIIRYLMNEFEEDPKKVWQSNMFGKSLYDLVSDGLHAKLSHIPDDSREKLAQTLEKIVNEGANGLICILL